MKNHIRILSFALLMGVVALSSCKSPGNGNDEKARAAVADTINRLMAEVTGYAGQLNADSTFKYLSADSSSAFMSEGMHYSRATLNAAFKNVYSRFKSQQISVIFSEVEVPAPGFAVWIGFLKNSYITKTDQVFEGWLCETWIWQRRSEGWKVIHYHESVLSAPTPDQKKLVETALGQLAGELAAKSLKPEDMKPLLTEYLKKYPSVYGTTLAFAPSESGGKSIKRAPYFYRSGNDFKQVDLPEAYDYTASEWYAVPVRAKAPCWSSPYYDDGGGGTLMVTYSIPLYGKDNKLIGVLTNDLELK
ncbi:MAG: nuclear transport factor 2 family protein [Bacteroidales bacterium]